jgi:hypothetical protein
MSFDLHSARQLLRQGDLRRLFVEEMGWERPGPDLAITLEGRTLTLKAVAQKRGFGVYICTPPGDDGALANHAMRRRIEEQVRKEVHQHLLIYTDGARSRTVWEWVRREPGRPIATRSYTHVPGQLEEPLLQRLQSMSFTLEEEESLGIVDVSARVQSTLDLEKVTKSFYDRFQAEHDAFAAHVQGIPDEEDRRWYVSVTLNRLMFVYFIQKKPFLDSDPDYLRHRLDASRQRGPDRFYREFLCTLFFRGFAAEPQERPPEVHALLGQVPYLNGGIFARHPIEERYGDNLQIADAAFAGLFTFFDSYRWHLDERPLRADNEINPDVLGYIFEKYINQKQMGAYYTKEDITGYIARNTLLPHLLDRARQYCPKAFDGPNGIWRHLQSDPNRYIYPAVRRGVDLPLPAEIAAGLHPPTLRQAVGEGPVRTLEARAAWNRPTPAEYALPTEIWRETVARRQRCEELRARLRAGDVRRANDLITLNLDITQFIQDAIEAAEDPALVAAFWQALQEVTVLDPTCGSGAFLFAALNLLEPLYEACLERMQSFCEEAPATRFAHAETFRSTLALAGNTALHPNRRYFVLKTIILRNLYGVDIMEEAVEICRLRLFLKLAAQVEAGERIEPLPDIDLNIRAGNTLVGFTTLAEVEEALTAQKEGTAATGERAMQRMMLDAHPEVAAALASIRDGAEIVERAYAEFQRQQTEENMRPADYAGGKQALLARLERLDETLHRALAHTYGVDPDGPGYAAWLASHRPFHWLTAYYGIMKRGGFDVIIGNPPYVDLRQSLGYRVTGYATLRTRNLYSLIMERCLTICVQTSRLGFIVPISSLSTQGYSSLQQLLLSVPGHFSFYDDRPSRLFDGLEHIRLSIHLLERMLRHRVEHTVTHCHRWSSAERPTLFQTIQFESAPDWQGTTTVPKLGTRIEHSIFDKLMNAGHKELSHTRRGSKAEIYYSRKLSGFLQVLDFVPEVYDGRGQRRSPSELKTLQFASSDEASAALCCLNSTLFRWYIDVMSDLRHVNAREVGGFPCDVEAILRVWRGDLVALSQRLSDSLRSTSEMRRMRFRHDRLEVQCIMPKYSKPIIDEIDHVLARHYGFTEEELDYIINYDIKYRMGEALNEEQEED